MQCPDISATTFSKPIANSQKNTNKTKKDPSLESGNTFITKASDFTQHYVAAPVSILSAVSGFLSFVSASIFNNKIDFIDKLADISSRGAIIFSSLFVALKNAYNKDFFGTLGGALDFAVPFLGKSEKLYQLRGLGASMDQIPPILKGLNDHPRVKEKYKKPFKELKSFDDSFKKTIFATETIIGDIIKGFKDRGKDSILKTASNLLVKGERTSEKNLLLSAIGVLTGGIFGGVLGMDKFGGTLRDLAGGYCDVAILDVALRKDSCGKRVAGSNDFLVSGISYSIGSILDLIYRWFKFENLHLAALGAERLGTFYWSKGIANQIDVEKKQSSQPEDVLPLQLIV